MADNVKISRRQALGVGLAGVPQRPLGAATHVEI